MLTDERAALTLYSLRTTDIGVAQKKWTDLMSKITFEFVRAAIAQGGMQPLAIVPMKKTMPIRHVLFYPITHQSFLEPSSRAALSLVTFSIPAGRCSAVPGG
jgi:hypothetical protein